MCNTLQLFVHSIRTIYLLDGGNKKNSQEGLRLLLGAGVELPTDLLQSQNDHGFRLLFKQPEIRVV